MGKKILILNGSPREKGNTAALVEEFTNGAKEAGNEVVSFYLQPMNIHGCLGCCGGGRNSSSPCVQKDDMDKIYPHYKEADIVVLASPMYYWTISGQLKTAIDRLFAVAEIKEKYDRVPKGGILLMSGAGNDEDNLEPVAHYFHSLMKQMNWKDLGLVYSGGNSKCGDIIGKADLEEARKLGAGIK